MKKILSRRRSRLASLSLAVVLLGSVLSACAPLVIGGVMTTAMVASDRRTSGAQLEDQGIELRAASRLRDAMGERGNASVTSYNRQVLITGEVGTAQDKALVEQTIAGVENVRSIVNELGVMGATSLTQRSRHRLPHGPRDPKRGRSLHDHRAQHPGRATRGAPAGDHHARGAGPLATAASTSGQFDILCACQVKSGGDADESIRAIGVQAPHRRHDRSCAYRSLLIRLEVSRRLPPTACKSA
jgi:hypothetical protein